MKYQLPWGAIMTYEQLREFWLANTNNPRKTDTAFGFWLEFKVECGAIKEIKER